MDILPIVLALAGLGILLYGMYLFGQAVEPVMSTKIGQRFGKVSSHKVRSYFFSGGLTFLTQKGTLNCRMLLSMVDMGTLSQRQALPFVLGVSLGGGVSMILMMFEGINLTMYLTLLCFVAAFINLFFKSDFCSSLAKGLMGFGMLFLGIHLVGSGAKYFFADPVVYDYVASTATPFMIVLLGLLLGLITTSSFASLTVISALSVGMGGPVSIEVAFLGMMAVGIGTAIADYIYTVGGHSIEAKRVMIFHIFTRGIISVLFGLLCLTPAVSWFYHLLGDNTIVTLSLGFMISLASGGILFLPFTRAYSWLFEKIIPSLPSEDKGVSEFILKENMVEVFAIGFPAIVRSIQKLLTIECASQEKLLVRIEYQKDISGCLGEIKKLDKAIKITENMLFRLSRSASQSDMNRLNVLHNVLGDITYLNKRSLKLYEMGNEVIKQNKTITEDGAKVLDYVYAEIKNEYTMCLELLKLVETGAVINNAKLKTILVANKQIFALCQKLKADYLRNLRQQSNNPLENNVQFSAMLLLDDVNTSLVNIAVKLGILSN